MKKLKLILFSVFLFLSFYNSSISFEQIISGKASVLDGDTIKINKKKLDFLELMHQKKNNFVKKVI